MNQVTLGDNESDLTGLGVDADNFYTCRTGPRTVEPDGGLHSRSESHTLSENLQQDDRCFC